MFKDISRKPQAGHEAENVLGRLAAGGRFTASTRLWSGLLALVICTVGLSVVDDAVAQPYAYIANNHGDDVTVVDTATNMVVATVDVGSDPFAVAVPPSGDFVYVTNIVSDSVSVIDTATNLVVDTVPVGNSPIAIAVTPRGDRVYVACLQGVTVIDSSTPGQYGDSNYCGRRCSTRNCGDARRSFRLCDKYSGPDA